MACTSRDTASTPHRTPGPLRLRRLSLGLTQVQLAEEAGLSREQVARLEVGAAEPSWRTVLALARALACEPLDIFPERGP